MAKDQSEIFAKVFEVVKQIPKGRVTSYGAIANYLGMSPRVVGWAMNAAHSAVEVIPAHRVLNRAGLLTGKAHFPTPTAMEELLVMDGLKVENEQVVDFKILVWDPAKHLEL
jgi:methylated-DNA-protein-cysteine methyltransferase-like protein